LIEFSGIGWSWTRFAHLPSFATAEDRFDAGLPPSLTANLDIGIFARILPSSLTFILP